MTRTLAPEASPIGLGAGVLDPLGETSPLGFAGWATSDPGCVDGASRGPRRSTAPRSMRANSSRRRARWSRLASDGLVPAAALPRASLGLAGDWGVWVLRRSGRSDMGAKDGKRRNRR